MKQQSKLTNFLSILFFLFIAFQVILTSLIWKDVQILKEQLNFAQVGLENAPSIQSKNYQLPSFHFTDVMGEEIPVSEIKTQSELIIFASHRCSACKTMYLHIGDFLSQNPDQQVILLTLESKEDNIQFIEDYSLGDYDNFTVGTITEELWRSFHVTATPTILLVGDNNETLKTWVGYSDTLWQEIANIN